MPRHGAPAPEAGRFALHGGVGHSPAVPLPDEQPDPIQLAVLRRMTPAERWDVARNLYWSARRLKTAFVRSEHPDWSDVAVEDYVRRVFLYGRP